MARVYSFCGTLYKLTGIQKVLLDVHHAIRDEHEAYVAGTISYDRLHKDLRIDAGEYRQLTNPFMFYKSVVIVHERKYLPLFWLLNHVFLQRIKVVYIHHNLLDNLRALTLLPRDIVSISDRCTDNLTGFFGVPPSRITKIRNCVTDIHPPKHKLPDGGITTVLLAARINDVKRQPDIVSHLRGRLSKDVRILFAGDGPLYDDLASVVGQDPQFNVLGYVGDIPRLMQQCDYVMLFSKAEGLPITLIEACMCGTPIICNDVGGNTEIAHNGANAIITNDWEGLVSTLNSLGSISPEQYARMSEAGRAIYESDFTFDRFKDQYLKLICTLS